MHSQPFSLTATVELLQQGKMEELLTEVLKSIRTNRTAPEQVDLPVFRPDVNDAK